MVSPHTSTAPAFTSGGPSARGTGAEGRPLSVPRLAEPGRAGLPDTMVIQENEWNPDQARSFEAALGLRTVRTQAPASRDCSRAASLIQTPSVAQVWRFGYPCPRTPSTHLQNESCRQSAACPTRSRQPPHTSRHVAPTGTPVEPLRSAALVFPPPLHRLQYLD